MMNGYMIPESGGDGLTDIRFRPRLRLTVGLKYARFG